MRRSTRLALGAGAVLGLSAWTAPVAAGAEGVHGQPSFREGADHVVFVQTDNTAGNQVVAYDRADDGSLTLADGSPASRAKSAQPLDGRCERRGKGLYVRFGRRPAHGQAKRALCVRAHGFEHRRGCEGLRGTRGARMSCDACLVEGEQDGFCLDAAHGDAHDVREAVTGITENLHVFDSRGRALQEACQPSRLGRLLVEASGLGEDLCCGAEADDRRYVLEPCPPGTLLVAAHHERLDA